MSSDVNGLYLTEQKRIHEFILTLKTSKQMAEGEGRFFMAECQVINVGGMRELESHLLATIIVIIQVINEC